MRASVPLSSKLLRIGCPAVLIGHDAFRLLRKRSMRGQSLGLRSVVLAGILASIASLISETRKRQCVRHPEIRSGWPGRSPAFGEANYSGRIDSEVFTDHIWFDKRLGRIWYLICSTAVPPLMILEINFPFMHLHFSTAICWRKALRMPARSLERTTHRLFCLELVVEYGGLRLHRAGDRKRGVRSLAE